MYYTLFQFVFTASPTNPRPDPSLVAPCDSSPCQNSGTCTNGNGAAYTCSCSNNYSGLHCEIPPVPGCDSNPCQNGGTCTNGDFGAYTCNCTANYEGTNCATARGCASSPCQNNGVCTNGGTASYTCDCAGTDFGGSNCDSLGKWHAIMGYLRGHLTRPLYRAQIPPETQI